jgi:hypothetical protein
MPAARRLQAYSLRNIRGAYKMNDSSGYTINELADILSTDPLLGDIFQAMVLLGRTELREKLGPKGQKTLIQVRALLEEILEKDE